MDRGQFKKLRVGDWIDHAEDPTFGPVRVVRVEQEIDWEAYRLAQRQGRQDVAPIDCKATWAVETADPYRFIKDTHFQTVAQLVLVDDPSPVLEAGEIQATYLGLLAILVLVLAIVASWLWPDQLASWTVVLVAATLGIAALLALYWEIADLLERAARERDRAGGEK